AVRDQVHDKLPLTFEDLGERELKNIARPVRVFRVGVPREELVVERRTADAPAIPLPSDGSAVAVLPFDNSSVSPGQEYFSDGLTEDIITALARWRTFPVIARNSSFAYKGTSPDVRAVARDLGARYVLEGSVRRAGDRVRITGQLIDGLTGHHV